MKKIEEAMCAAVKERRYLKSGNTELNVAKQRTIVEVATELEKAKDAVRFCLEHESGLVDMHGLSYWAGVVEHRRKEIKEMI